MRKENLAILLCRSRSRVLADDALDPPLVLHAVLLEQVVGLSLGRRLGVRVVEKVLDTQEDLLHGDGGLPRLILVQDGEADGARRVNVRVEQGRDKFACRITKISFDQLTARLSRTLTLGRLRRVLCAMD